jgi:hypothetical protein
VRYKYKSWPRPGGPHPAFPKQDVIWQPVLSVQLAYPAKHSPPTTRFEAFVDSGSPYCYFHSSIGKAIGIKIDTGFKDNLGGIVRGPMSDVFFHDVSLYVGADIIKIRAAFCNELSAAGILGRTGFFDNFIVTFDHSGIPPCFDIQRVVRV